MDELKDIIKEILHDSGQATLGPWRVSPSNTDGYDAYSLVNGYQRAVKYRDFIRTMDAEFIAQSRSRVPFLCHCINDLLDVIDVDEMNKGKLEELESKLNRRIMGEL